MIRTVVATDQDGLDMNIHIFQFRVPDEDFDLLGAVRKAADQYCRTPQGQAVYEGNSKQFNWGDFDLHVPNAFCEELGFQRVFTRNGLQVSFNEDLIEGGDVYDI